VADRDDIVAAKAEEIEARYSSRCHRVRAARTAWGPLKET
jgi:hypothetical protein